MHLGKERHMSEFQLTDKVRVKKVGVIIKVINATSGKLILEQ